MGPENGRLRRMMRINTDNTPVSRDAPEGRRAFELLSQGLPPLTLDFPSICEMALPPRAVVTIGIQHEDSV